MGGDSLNIIERIEITHPYLLIVEGKDEVEFFKAFFQFLKKSSYEWDGLDNIQIISTDSKDKLPKFLDIVPDLVNSDQIKRIAIIQDADNDQNRFFKQIQKTLIKIGFPVPDRQIEPKTGKINVSQEISLQVLIIGIDGKGMLEDVCLDSVSNDCAMPCVNSFFDCLTKFYSTSELIPPKNLSKAKTRVFLASRKECTVYIGLAAKEGYWDFTKPSFDRMKELLQFLINN